MTRRWRALLTEIDKMVPYWEGVLSKGKRTNTAEQLTELEAGIMRLINEDRRREKMRSYQTLAKELGVPECKVRDVCRGLKAKGLIGP